MKNELNQALDNLHCLRAGLAEVCVRCHLFGDDTQRIIGLCDDVSPLDDTRTLQDFKELRRVLGKALDKGVDLERDAIIEVFWRSLDRELAMLKGLTSPTG